MFSWFLLKSTDYSIEVYKQSSFIRIDKFLCYRCIESPLNKTIYTKMTRTFALRAKRKAVQWRPNNSHQSTSATLRQRSPIKMGNKQTIFSEEEIENYMVCLFLFNILH